MDIDSNLPSAKPISSTAASNRKLRRRYKALCSSVCGKPYSSASKCLLPAVKSWTYAQKIKFMKEQNNHDVEFNTKHINTNVLKVEEQKEGKIHHDNGHMNIDPTYSLLVDDVGTKDSNYSNLSLEFDTSASEYYGVGEWATAALKSFQPEIPSSEKIASQTSRFPSSSCDESKLVQDVGELKTTKQHCIAEQNLTYHNFNLTSSSDDRTSTSSIKYKKLKSITNFRKRPNSTEETASGKCDSVIEQQKYKKKAANKSTSSTSTSSNNSNPENAAKKTTIAPFSTNCRLMPKHKGSPHRSPNLPLSPLLSDHEKDLVLPYVNWQRSSTSKYISVTPAFDKIHKNRQIYSFVSNEPSRYLESKCFSKASLSSRLRHHDSFKSKLKPSNTEDVKSNESTLLKSGDYLQLKRNVSLANFNYKEIIETTLKNSKETRSNNGISKTIDVSDVLLNCIDTCVKIQCVQKVCKCKVCGFSIDVTNRKKGIDEADDAQSLLQAHVKEHSLKELYDVVCKTSNY